MNREELREACTLAGGDLEMVPFEKYGAVTVPVWNFPKHGFGMYESHPMLLAAVAEIMMGILREMGLDSHYHHNMTHPKARPDTDHEYPITQTAKYRVRAAVPLLKMTKGRT